MNQITQAKRRVYRRELLERLGYGQTWFRKLEKDGRIPAGRVDQGGKRKWWFDDEADAIVAGRHADEGEPA